MPAFCLLAAVFFVLAARTYVSDLKQAQAARAARRGRPRAATRVIEMRKRPAMNIETNDDPLPARNRRLASGNWNPDWEPFAKLDPAWTEKAIALAIAPAVAGALDKKTIELIGIALDASCTHLYAPGVRRHIQRALKAGATREEITAVLQLACMQGLHSMCVAAPILLDGARRPRPSPRLDQPPTPKEHDMNFLDGSLFPENQEKLVITAAPYGPEWMPSDFPEDIPVTMEAQVQKAVDCYNAGATVLHLHVRELDGKGSKRLSKFNELIAGVRKAVPDMIIQVGGSISFAPETDGAKAKWLSDDTRHMLAELDPKPDQVTVTVNTTQMNVVEQMEIDDLAGTSLAEPENYQAYREMIVPSSPSWVEEHVRRLSAAGIQSAFQFYNINSYETVERLIRRGVYKGPLVMNWVAIGGGMDQPTIYSLANFLRAIPDGSMLTVESSMRNVLPINMMGIAMGLHVRCGIEDNLWNQSRTGKMTTVQQIEQLVRISREFGREVATGKEAREICKIGVFYDTVEETLAANGFAPNAKGRQQGFLRKVA